MPKNINERVSSLEGQSELLLKAVEKIGEKAEGLVNSLGELKCRTNTYRLETLTTVEIDHEKRLKALEDFRASIGGRRSLIIGLLIFCSNIITGLVVAWGAGLFGPG